MSITSSSRSTKAETISTAISFSLFSGKRGRIVSNWEKPLQPALTLIFRDFVNKFDILFVTGGRLSG